MYTIYTKDTCGYCEKAEKLLQDRFLEYELIDVQTDPQTLEMFKRRKWSTVPQIMKGDVHIGGFEQLEEHINTGYWKSKYSEGNK
jgi:glutaredoxin